MRAYELSATEKTIGFSKAVRTGQTGVFSVANARIFSRERTQNGRVGGKKARQECTKKPNQEARSGGVPPFERGNKGYVSYRNSAQGTGSLRVPRDENRPTFNDSKSETLSFPSFSSLIRENFRFLRKTVFKPYVKMLCMRLILFYQKRISKHTCLYRPTCSQYTLESINNRGVIVGILLGAWRILRCNPFSKGGYDPAPEKRAAKWVK